MYKRFRHLLIEDPDNPPAEDEIRAIERKLQAKLPTDFLDFLDVANGGRMDEYLISVPLEPETEIMCFGIIFTTKRMGSRSFLGELQRQQNADYFFQIPEKVLPFASDGSSYLYLDLRNESQATVVAFVEGLPAWTGLHQQNTLVKLTDTFSDFIDMLKLDVEDAKELLLAAIARDDKSAISANIDFLELALPDWRQVFGIDYDDGSPKQLSFLE